MKYDLSRRPTRAATRVLNAFTYSFFDLLEQKSFEEISVNEICTAADYPRATFYNYFNDKYDLLNYLWLRATSDIKLEDYEQLDPSQILPVFFSRLYDLLESLDTKIEKILQHNASDGYFLGSLRIYFDTQIKKLVDRYKFSEDISLPHDLLIMHISNTVYMVFEWRFIKRNACSKEQAYSYIVTLLEGIRPQSPIF